MKTLEECVVAAMAVDGTSTDILTYLPYIWQDFGEMGASTANIIALVEKYCTDYANLKVLDLGCGKGSLSVKLAERFKCSCFGLDALKGFVIEAEDKAKRYKVDALCTFEVADIRGRIKELSKYDVIVLAAIGQVLGSYYETITTILPHLKPNGLVIVDDAYVDDTSTLNHPAIFKRSEILSQIQNAGMMLVDEIRNSKVYDTHEESDEQVDCVQLRCKELIEKYPEKAQLFETYVHNQQQENDVFKCKAISSTMAIKRITKDSCT